MNHDPYVRSLISVLSSSSIKPDADRRAYDYGIRGGAESLLGFQIGGESQSGAPHGWRHFDVDQIRHLRVLERRFGGTRADSAQHHGTWDTLFARVT